MEHAYSSRQPVATPWRTAAIVAAGVAAVELFVLIVVGVVFGAKVLTDQAEKALTPPRAVAKETGSTPAVTTGVQNKEKAHAAAPAAELPRSRTSVIVLNGNGVSGAAAVTADKVRGFSYIIAATGNAPRSDFGRSVVMYRPGFKAEALRLGRDMHVRRAVPLDGLTRRDLQGAHLALIIGG